jgi:hypothetical protein
MYMRWTALYRDKDRPLPSCLGFRGPKGRPVRTDMKHALETTGTTSGVEGEYEDRRRRAEDHSLHDLHPQMNRFASRDVFFDPCVYMWLAGAGRAWKGRREDVQNVSLAMDLSAHDRGVSFLARTGIHKSILIHIFTVPHGHGSYIGVHRQEKGGHPVL